MKSILTILVAYSAFFMSCAKEVSEEDRKREESARELQRLAAAEGQYPGYIQISDTEAVPFLLEVLTKRNPQDGSDQPSLEATLTIGFFGGGSLIAERASFDWGAGKLTAVFSKSPAKSSGQILSDNQFFAAPQASSGNTVEIELTGVQGRKVFASGSVKGARIGERPLISMAENPIEKGVTEFRFPMNLTLGVGEQKAILNIKRVNLDVPAPASSDMPVFPPLQSSIRLTMASNISQNVDVTWYDPLAGTLDFRLRDNSWLRLEHIFAQIKEGSPTNLVDNTSSRFSGSVYIGGQSAYGVGLSFDARRLSQPEYAPRPFSRYFIGTYRGSANGLPLESYAVVDDTGDTLSNPPEFGFGTIPDLRLRIVRCMGGEPINTMSFRSFSLDYMAGSANFSDLSGSGKRFTEIKVSNNWLTLDGIIRDGNTGSSGPRNPVFHYDAAASQSSEPQCSQLDTDN